MKHRFYRQCQLQSVGSSLNVSMNSVKDHMLRVWPWERLVYLTHSPYSPISVPLITNRLFHILLHYFTLTYLNMNQKKSKNLRSLKYYINWTQYHSLDKSESHSYKVFLEDETLCSNKTLQTL